MGRYVLIKLLLIIPSLLVLSLIIFFLSKLAPGDPVAGVVELRGQVTEEFNTGEVSPDYINVAKDLNLDLPLFYFDIQPNYYPDTLYKVIHPSRKKILKNWLEQNRNWISIQNFVDSHRSLKKEVLLVPDSLLSSIQKSQLMQSLKVIESTESLEMVNERMTKLEDGLIQNNYYQSLALEKSFISLKNSMGPLVTNLEDPFGFFPKINFHGARNQYHHWFSNIIQLNFGESIVDARPAGKKIYYAMGWTLFYVLIAYLFSLLISIPTGLFNAWYHGKNIEKMISSVSFIFYAFPLFWIATLAAVFLTNGLYAPWLHIFPGIGVGDISSSMSFTERIGTSFPYLILPALVLALHSAASGIRIVRNSAFTELKSDYYITAKAKGLNSFQLLWRHILPNAMLPIITLLVSSFPAALTGSVVLEVIFNIPGMGRLLYDSILFMDWNIVFGILIIMGLITFVFYLIGDLLYAYLNPKIKYGMK